MTPGCRRAALRFIEAAYHLFIGLCLKRNFELASLLSVFDNQLGITSLQRRLSQFIAGEQQCSLNQPMPSTLAGNSKAEIHRSPSITVIESLLLQQAASI